MDERAFAALSKRVAAAQSRRGMAHAIIAGVVGTALSPLGQSEDAEAAFGYCSPPGVPCNSDEKCCAGKCRGGVCGCKKKGRSCINRVGIACCSQKCRKGKCK